MAHKQFLETIERGAKFLATPTAQAARGHLHPALESALSVLAIFADGKPHEYEEVADAVGMHHSTVRQILRALEKGGYPLSHTYAEVKTATGGRPTVRVQKTKRRR